MEFKGTKGEWEVSKDGIDRNSCNALVLTIDVPNKSIINFIDVYGDHRDDEIKLKANAHLISAAPELLEALSGIVDLYSEINPALLTGDVADRITASKKAINKALGQ